jgi:predicted nucleic acid-binding protein
MIVVSDTSPICYLVLVGEIELLPQLFKEIVIPQAVYNELTSTSAPAILQNWSEEIPKWLLINDVDPVQDQQLNRLDLGEKEAIILAEKLKAGLIIIDEKAARKIAIDRGLKVTGLLGVLEIAIKQDLIDIKTAIEKLQKTSFRASPQLIQSLALRELLCK